MRISRRAMLKGGALAGSVVAMPAVAVEMHSSPVIVFDSGIAESAAFATSRAGLRHIDLADGVEAGWRALGQPDRISGLTRWSDWTVLRGALEEQGLRVVHEARVPAPLSRRDHLFRWTMAAR